jgi:hypothetical protein
MVWEQVWAILGVTAGLFILSISVTITLFIWNRSESRSDNRRVLDILDAIKEDMKEFHTKLATQDLEFKMRLTAIEEKNKK